MEGEIAHVRETWACPRCRGALEAPAAALRCADCGAGYEVVAGIPDFRLSPGSPEAVERERTRALELRERAERTAPEELIFRVFSSRPGWTRARSRHRTRMILDGIDRLARELEGWLAPCATGSGRILDLGCGAGQLLVALGAAGRRAVGVDVSLTWLVVAGALLRDRGVEPVLAAGEAEALPLRRRSVSSVLSLDVIEHVADPGRFLREIDRVLADDGTVALTTPNRFSPAAEPHIFVWGVGWLPRRFQKAYAEWRTGESYEGVRLLSLWEIRRLFRRHTRLAPTVLVPAIPPEELDRFALYREVLARAYNRLVSWRAVRAAIRPVAPFYRILASPRSSEVG